jgi:hypothetical protein
MNKMFKQKLFLSGLFLYFFSMASAQDENLLKGIEDEKPKAEKVTKAFKSTRVINAHSTETLGKGNLDFRILHRFDPIKGGIKEFFGLDHAYMRMSFDYGLSDRVMIGAGRTTYRKEYDVFAKAKLLQQTKGEKAMPLSLAIAVGGMVYTENFEPVKPDVGDRSAYYIQLIAGRKFSDRFSFQLSPILVHRSRVVLENEEKTVIALGGGARYKLNKRFALTVDYHHPLDGVNEIYTNPLSVGFDIETGGHVFQLHFSNAVGMNERAYITQTAGKFFDGNIRFGFNLSRVFKLGKR